MKRPSKSLVQEELEHSLDEWGVGVASEPEEHVTFQRKVIDEGLNMLNNKE